MKSVSEVSDIQKLGISREEPYDKIESCHLMSEVLEIDKGDIVFTPKLSENHPAMTSLKTGKMMFTEKYFFDAREDSFYRFQTALVHEAAHKNDILRWEEEGVRGTDRFIKLFRFFTEGLATQFDNRPGSYPEAKELFDRFYSSAYESEEEISPGEILKEEFDDRKLLLGMFELEGENFYDFQILEESELSNYKGDIYSLAEENYSERYPDKDISIIEEDTELISLEDDEYEILGQHYLDTYRDTREKIEKYLEVSRPFLERYLNDEERFSEEIVNR